MKPMGAIRPYTAKITVAARWRVSGWKACYIPVTKQNLTQNKHVDKTIVFTFSILGVRHNNPGLHCDACTWQKKRSQCAGISQDWGKWEKNIWLRLYGTKPCHFVHPRTGGGYREVRHQPRYREVRDQGGYRGVKGGFGWPYSFSVLYRVFAFDIIKITAHFIWIHHSKQHISILQNL